jgi:hypothetical protein
MPAILIALASIHAFSTQGRLLTDAELATFHRDGAVLVPELLSPRELRRATRAASRELQNGMRVGSLYTAVSGLRRTLSLQGALRHVALDSTAPAIAAQCMDLKPCRSQPLQVPPFCASWTNPRASQGNAQLF